MSHALLPILAFVLIGAFAAYHRLRLATWAALLAVALVACWLLGAHRTTTAVVAIVSALVAVPLLIPAIQVNIRAGNLPPADESGLHSLKIPLNRF